MSKRCLDNLKPGDTVVFRNTYGRLITIVFDKVSGAYYYGISLNGKSRTYFRSKEVVRIIKKNS